MKTIIFAALLTFFPIGSAFAQAPAPIVPPPVGQPGQQIVAPLPMFSITVSPILLILPILEVTTECGSLPNGVALIVGGGNVTVKDDFDTDYTFTAMEIGAQFKYYFTGNFKTGFHAGAEAMYLYVATEDEEISGTGAGMTIGAFVGYKHTFSFGLTLEAQLGYQYMAVTAEAEDSAGNTGSDSDSKGGVLGNLNAGFSF